MHIYVVYTHAYVCMYILYTWLRRAMRVQKVHYCIQISLITCVLSICICIHTHIYTCLHTHTHVGIYRTQDLDVPCVFKSYSFFNTCSRKECIYSVAMRHISPRKYQKLIIHTYVRTYIHTYMYAFNQGQVGISRMGLRAPSKHRYVISCQYDKFFFAFLDGITRI